MPFLARTIHFDESDSRIYARPSESGEWAIAGGFEFSNWSEADLVGKARQAFANGWLGFPSFGRATLVAVTLAEEAEITDLEGQLARHFVEIYGAPDEASAKAAAAEEIAFMVELCSDHDPNTILSVTRELTDAGVREPFTAIKGEAAELAQIAIHVTDD